METSLAQLVDTDFSREKIELIKRTVCVGTTDDELQLFLYVAKKTGLDPFTRQIYALKRWRKDLGREVMTVQTGIDGYRVVADRTGKLAGISDPVFDSESDDHPWKASVMVTKIVGSQIAEFTASARWSEYVQTNKDGNATGMWVKMPYLMLGKCAEALALRKAFPADLSGVYTAEEMAQADNDQQREAVFAEVEKQKAQHPISDVVVTGVNAAGTITSVSAIPPELDWSYNRASGVLICRIVEAKAAKKKDGSGEYVTLLVNDQLEKGKKPLLYYWHATHRAELLAAIGKVVKLIITPKEKGFTVESVMEIDGKRMIDEEKSANAETQARLLASTLEFDEEMLRELYSRWCKGSWPDTLQKLKDEQIRREVMEKEPA